MADESEERAQRDVTAATEGYGGPVSDEELADVYLPEGQDAVQDTGSAQEADAGGETSAPDAAPDGSGTLEGSSGEPAIEPPD
jgi:hypothetical protein